MSVAFLMVTCCLEESRANLLQQVTDNLQTQAPELRDKITVFDNASTVPAAFTALSPFSKVYQADRNVGYWSAIDWWLRHLSADPPEFTYIIESDMMHYGFDKLWLCAWYLQSHPEVGSVRLHEYSVENKHLYNKDAPLPESRRSLWQSHTNKITGEPVQLVQSDVSDIWETNFLTQLPALNRYQTMVEIFNELRDQKSFSELDFQRLYWRRYQKTAILDGGIFHCNLNPYGAKGITGSWTSPAELKKIGYQTTRVASITPRDQYTVTAMR